MGSAVDMVAAVVVADDLADGKKHTWQLITEGRWYEMPAGDRTGPRGMGPMTGRGVGYCAGYDVPGYANPISGPVHGRGFGRGRGRAWVGGWGRGRGWRHWYYATGMPGWARFGYAPLAQPLTREQETEFLKAQADGLQRELDAVSQRIAELEEA